MVIRPLLQRSRGFVVTLPDILHKTNTQKNTSAPSLNVGESALVTYLELWQFFSILTMLSSKSFFSNGLDL